MTLRLRCAVLCRWASKTISTTAAPIVAKPLRTQRKPSVQLWRVTIPKFPCKFRVFNFSNPTTNRYEIATDALDIVCAAVAWVSFQFPTRVSTFRIASLACRALDRVTALGTSGTSISGAKGSQRYFRRSVHTSVLCRAVLPSPAARATLDTSCTSISGAKGSQPHFWPSWTLCCAVLRFVDFHDHRSDRRETATYVMETLYPAMACANFDVST